MKILLLHQNFPGQFSHLATALTNRGHGVLALTDSTNARTSSTQTARYRFQKPAFDQTGSVLARSFADHAARGEAVARACMALRDKHTFEPDVVFGHIGWGETLFLKEIWPDARHLLYAELFYRTRGLDTGFDPEFQRDDDWQRIRTTARQAHLLLAMNGADQALSPTRWQADSCPQHLRSKITVVHDGIDTGVVKPDAAASVELPGTNLRLKAGDETLTFVNRNLEPYRGYHIFMRALPEVLAARPNANVVIVGGDDVSYGTKPPDGKTWKSIFLDEVKDRLDLSRVHFVCKVPYPMFLDLMRVTRVHAYLTTSVWLTLE